MAFNPEIQYRPPKAAFLFPAILDRGVGSHMKGTTMELENMTLQELKQLRKDVDKAIDTYEARQLAEVRAKLEAQAKEMGYKLEDVLSAPKRGKAQSIPKYRHPENPTLTWTGKGRKPDWFKQAIEAGMTEQDLKI
jgi:DNA-binding protein H-NS